MASRELFGHASELRFGLLDARAGRQKRDAPVPAVVARALPIVPGILSYDPALKREPELTRGATDAVLWISSPLSPSWSFSLLGSGHEQGRVDVDDDGWSDIAGYGRGVVRPRVFWDGGEGRSFFVTAGFTYEDRTGGTLP